MEHLGYSCNPTSYFQTQTPDDSLRDFQTIISPQISSFQSWSLGLVSRCMEIASMLQRSRMDVCSFIVGRWTYYPGTPWVPRTSDGDHGPQPPVTVMDDFRDLGLLVFHSPRVSKKSSKGAMEYTHWTVFPTQLMIRTPVVSFRSLRYCPWKQIFQLT